MITLSVPEILFDKSELITSSALIVLDLVPKTWPCTLGCFIHSSVVSLRGVPAGHQSICRWKASHLPTVDHSDLLEPVGLSNLFFFFFFRDLFFFILFIYFFIYF